MTVRDSGAQLLFERDFGEKMEKARASRDGFLCSSALTV
jgi:hypothetical protein